MFAMMAGILAFSLLLAACGSTSTTTGTTPTAAAATNGKGCMKVGVLLPETATSARWDNKDRPIVGESIPKQLPGATVDYNNAEGSADTQQTQAQADLTKGDCILVVAAVDSIKSAAIVSAAKAKGVPVIAYDRLIYSPDLDYYVSFRQHEGRRTTGSVYCGSLQELCHC